MRKEELCGGAGWLQAVSEAGSALVPSAWLWFPLPGPTSLCLALFSVFLKEGLSLENLFLGALLYETLI